jgi:hypothetical protein
MGLFPPRTGIYLSLLKIVLFVLVNNFCFFMWTGPIQGGSDIVLESLAERKVAQQALEFLEQPSNLQPPPT